MEDGKKLELTKLPLKASEFDVNLGDIGQCPLTGLIKQTLESDGKRRTMYMFIAEHMHANRPCIIAAGPVSHSPKQFLMESGLKEFAEKAQVFTCLLEPGEGGWKHDGSDARFMNEALQKVQQREYYVIMPDCIYAMGFGAGADIANQAVMEKTEEWSGMALFHPEFPSERTWEPSGSDTQLPVWIFADETTNEISGLVQYWAGVNKDEKKPLYDKYGTEVYLPVPVKPGLKTNDDCIAQTRVTCNYSHKISGTDLLEYAWDYVGAARRHRSFGKKILRYYREPEKNGGVLQTLYVDNIMREWYEYVPKSVEMQREEEHQAVPLVVVLHGRGGDAQSFFDITDMSVVAEERRFIAAFPSADFYQMKEDGLKNIRLWNGFYNGKKTDSLNFIRKMIDSICARYQVDRGRIYLFGQSSGGFMSIYSAMAASGLFAAAAPLSSFCCFKNEVPIFHYDKSEWFADGHVPMFMMFGDKDELFEITSLWPLPDNQKPAVTFIRFLIHEFELFEEPDRYSCYPITYYTWYNRKHTPMLKIGIVKDMPHGNYPEQGSIVYEQFLCQFSRNPDGRLLYRNHFAE